MSADISQPSVDDDRWTIDQQRRFVGMDCTVSVDSDERSGVIQAIWCFRGQPGARRHRTRRGTRRPFKPRERRKGTGQLRKECLTRAPSFKPHRALVTQYQGRRTATRLRTGSSWTLLPKSVGTVKLSPISGSSAQFDSRRPLVGDRYRRVSTVDMTESRRRQPNAEPLLREVGHV